MRARPNRCGCPPKWNWNANKCSSSTNQPLQRHGQTDKRPDLPACEWAREKTTFTYCPTHDAAAAAAYKSSQSHRVWVRTTTTTASSVSVGERSFAAGKRKKLFIFAGSFDGWKLFAVTSIRINRNGLLRLFITAPNGNEFPGDFAITRFVSR